jgi:hypothetical protein
VARFACVLGVALLLAAPAAAATITRHAATKSYRLTLVVGPQEPMYTQAQVKAQHPKTGEVVIGGSMGASHAMTMEGGATRHLEVQVLSRATGKPATGVTPALTLTAQAAMMSPARTSMLEVMAMQGIGKGMSDLHFGNNVQLSAGRDYRVTVVVKGQRASFSFRAQ